jgi:hypothetical protein
MNALPGIEAVHLGQDLVQRLLALVMAAQRRPAATRPADRVQLVDEDDRGRGLPRLLEQVADTGRADADDHLDELGRAEAEERDARLSRNRPREEGLAGARRADQQHALRHGPAESLVLGRMLQEVDDLGQLVLGLVYAGDVVEGDGRLRLAVALGAALAEPEQPAPARRRRPPTEPHEAGDQQQGGAEPDQERKPGRPALIHGLDHDPLLFQQRLESRIGEDRSLRLELRRGARRGSASEGRRRRVDARRRRCRGWIGHARLEGALDRLAHTGDVPDIAGLDLGLEDRVGNGDRRGRREEHAHEQVVGQQESREDQPPRLPPRARRTGRGPLRARRRTAGGPSGHLAGR